MEQRKKAKPPGGSGGVLVSHVHQLSGRLFSRILKEQGIDALNPAQGRIVFALWQADGISQTELATRTKLDKSGLAIMLDRLEEAGQVERRLDATDARKSMIFLTETNKALHASYRIASEKMLGIFYAGFSSARIADFETALQDIVANCEGAM
jgi:DNA-binding MarR family transcriptional regulator